MDAQRAFCAATQCYVVRIYDQSPQGNHLDTSPAGGACDRPLAPVNASRDRITLGGGLAGGAYFEGGQSTVGLEPGQAACPSLASSVHACSACRPLGQDGLPQRPDTWRGDGAHRPDDLHGDQGRPRQCGL